VQTPVSTDPRDLVALLERTPAEQWDDIRRHLFEQLADRSPAEVEQLFADASDEAMNIANCRHERAGLREELRQIKLRIADAQRHLRELRGPLYDTSYAEGHAGYRLAEALVELATKAAEADAMNEDIHFNRVSS